MGLTRTPMSRLDERLTRSQDLGYTQAQSEHTIYGLDMQPLIDSLNYADRARPLIHLLGLMSPRQPVARERLIRLAEEGPDADDRAGRVGTGTGR